MDMVLPWICSMYKDTGNAKNEMYAEQWSSKGGDLGYVLSYFCCVTYHKIIRNFYSDVSGC